MKISHHPDFATIVAYASGSLDEAHAVLISCHLEVCAECRSMLRTAEEIAGSMLCDEPEVAEVSDGAFGRLLEKMSAAPESSNIDVTPRKELRGGWHEMPKALRNYLDGDLDSVKWNRVAPGVWQKPIELSDGAQSSLRLLRIAPGKAMPEHGHGGQEITLVLKGAYDDRFGRFAAGDVADLDDEIEHQPIVTSDEDCICLAATEAPTRFKGIIARMMQPFVGI